MIPPVSYCHFSTMNTRFQINQANQDEDPFQFEVEFNSFKGSYIGHDLLSHLNIIDPEQTIFQFVPGYINAFPESKCFFEYFFPFYMGSHVTQDELVSFYEENYCDFVEFFKLNHPDWNEYTHTECLQHFKDTFDIYANDNDVIYFNPNISNKMYQMTPRTLEKPHFSVVMAGNNGNDGNLLGFGYFPNASGETTALNRQIGEYGPYGYSGRIDLETYFHEEVEDRDRIEFYLERGNVRFDFDNNDGSRYTCEHPIYPNFLFEKPNQNFLF